MGPDSLRLLPIHKIPLCCMWLGDSLRLSDVISSTALWVMIVASELCFCDLLKIVHGDSCSVLLAASGAFPSAWQERQCWCSSHDR